MSIQVEACQAKDVSNCKDLSPLLVEIDLSIPDYLKWKKAKHLAMVFYHSNFLFDQK